MGVSDFNDMELDAIGEIMNISLGASATAVSTMLGTKVNITTPVVRVLTSDEFEFKSLEPAVGVEIAYTEGLEGSNIMMFRRNDVRIIVGMLMGADIPDEEFEMNEINVSAICEVMNQMMGSSATALSEFLGNPVNISTPVSFPIESENGFKEKYFTSGVKMVVVRFSLEIEGKLESEFLNIMSSKLAKHLLEPFEISFQQAEQYQMEEDARKQAEAEKQDGEVREEPQQEQTPSMQEEQPAPEQEMQPAPMQGMQPAPPQQMQAAPEQQMQPAPMQEMQAPPMQEAQLAPTQEMQPAPPQQMQATPEQQMQAAPPQTPSQSQSSDSAVRTGAQTASGQIPEQPQYVTQAGQAQPQYAPAMGQSVIYQSAPDPVMLQLLNQMQQSQAQMMEFMKDMKAKEKQQPPRDNILIHPVNSPQMETGVEEGAEERANQEMLMKVPLELSVEVGRTKKLVKDILELTQGSLVVLDKMAGEQADLFVNGQCVAKGDIVVVEDNFGIRITEIVARDLNPEIL